MPRRNPWILTVIRTLMFLVFVSAALLKVWGLSHGGPSEDVLPVLRSGTVSGAIALVELAVAAALATRVWHLGCYGVLMFAIGGNLVLAYSTSVQGRVTHCGCFGSYPLDAGTHLALSVILFVLGSLALFVGRRRPTAGVLPDVPDMRG
jgi:hypothetical protein